MLYEPTVILTCPFSGSTAVAQIFEAHGCWGGEYQPLVDSKHPSSAYENLAMRAFHSVAYGDSAVVSSCNAMMQPLEGVRDVLVSQTMGVPPERPWFVKHHAMYWAMWHEFRPHWVLVRRDEESVVASLSEQTDYPPMSAKAAKDLYQRCNYIMDAVRDWFLGVDVSTPALMAGDFTAIRRALIRGGLKADDEIIGGCLDKSLWHYNSQPSRCETNGLLQA